MSSITRPLANRAVHLRITPRPSNLGESREIMRLLSGFGEIEYFKNLRYDTLTHPNAALVIYKGEEAARECLKKSPIRFRMGRASLPQRREADESGEDSMGDSAVGSAEEEKTVPRGPLGAPFGMGAATSPGQTRSMSTNARKDRPAEGYTPFFGVDPLGGLTSTPDPEESSSRPQRTPRPKQPLLHSSNTDPNARIYQIQANPSFRHFRDHVNVNHYHGNFAIDTKTFGQAEMSKKVPLLGLSCLNWKAEERQWSIVQLERDRERKGIMKRKSLGEMWREAHGGEEVGG
jgi:hypothetical protein